MILYQFSWQNNKAQSFNSDIQLPSIPQSTSDHFQHMCLHVSGDNPIPQCSGLANNIIKILGWKLYHCTLKSKIIQYIATVIMNA